MWGAVETQHAAAQGVKHISVQSSVSLQHLPYDKDLEHALPAEIVDRLAFAKQKLGEIVAAAKAAHGVKPVPLTSALPTVGALLPHCGGSHAVAGPPDARSGMHAHTARVCYHLSRVASVLMGCSLWSYAALLSQLLMCMHCSILTKIWRLERGGVAQVTRRMRWRRTLFNRGEVFAKRRGSQIQTVDFPTTSIGSFPQTAGAHAALPHLPHTAHVSHRVAA